MPHVTEQPDHAPNAAHAQLLGQQPAEHGSLSLSTSHVPPHDSADDLVRERERMPLPHDTEHDVHGDHALSTQLTAQHAPPQFSDCDKSVGQAEPPHADVRVTARLRERVPPPHCCEHAAHCDQSETWQFCAQQPVLQFCDSFTTPVEQEPPHDSGVIERERDCEPPPHPTEQVPQPDHAPMTQFDGQQPVLHCCDCDVCDSEHEPPQVAAVMERERDCEPPPHPAEQAVQPDHAPITQSDAQHCVLHCCDCVVCDSEHEPPHDAAEMERERDCVPPPQPAEQPDQSDQPPILQLTGQQPVLHCCDCVVCDSEHEPPHDAAEMERERDCVPPPQPTEQPDQSDQPPILQLTGQQPASHGCVSENGGHGAPPFAGERVT
jgi:hypothetical protein